MKAHLKNYLTFFLPFLHNFFRNLYVSFRKCPHFAHIYALYSFISNEVDSTNKRAPLSASTKKNLTLFDEVGLHRVRVVGATAQDVAPHETFHKFTPPKALPQGSAFLPFSLIFIGSFYFSTEYVTFPSMITN